MATTTTVSEQVLVEAQGAARAGKIDEVLPTLVRAAAEGSAAAAYSLAEIAAARGDWDAVLDRLAQFAPGEASVRAGNVKRDAAGLAWRAAEVTGRWADARRVVEALPERAVGGLLHRSLLALLAADGVGPAPVLAGSSDTPEQRLAKLDRAKAGGDPFSIVMFAKEDPAFDADVVAHYDAAEPKLRWDYALAAIPALLRAGQEERAWRALLAKLPSWTPVEACQLAPITVLWHPGLEALMTKERAAGLLARA